jgi:large subunit ribosomal protein L29
MPTPKTDFRGMSDEQLAQSLKESEKAVFSLRFQSASDRKETATELRKAKKDIARIRTLQRERELTKLKALPADQLATRVASLTAKDEVGGPGKRLVRRQLRRVEALHAKATATKGTK